MDDVSIRELRNHGGEVVDRVARGERITITRAGRAVAELRPLPSPSPSPSPPLSAEELLARSRHLPDVDPVLLRAEIDDSFDLRL